MSLPVTLSFLIYFLSVVVPVTLSFIIYFLSMVVPFTLFILSFLIVYTVSRILWTGDQPDARPTPRDNTNTNKRTRTSMARTDYLIVPEGRNNSYLTPLGQSDRHLQYHILHRVCFKNNFETILLFRVTEMSKSHYDRQSVCRFVLVSCPFWSRCYIYLSNNYFLYFSCKAPSLTRGRVCNLQCNDASWISSYIETDGLLASLSWCFFVWQLLHLLGVGLPHPYPPWTEWSSPNSKSR
jgi:hypothetical protein